MFAQRHFHEYGTTREQLAQIALNARKNAALNPKAIYRDPMTMDDYLAARMISTPFCLYDCDVPCDGGTAVIVSRVDTAPDLRKPPIQVEAVGTALHGRPSWDQFDDLTTMANRDAGAQLWTRTDLKPSDVQLAEMYDGFSLHHDVVARGAGLLRRRGSRARSSRAASASRATACSRSTRTAASSRPGRLHGYGFLHEACVQLWGEAGDRQVPGDPEVGVACAGGGPLAGALLLDPPPANRRGRCWRAPRAGWSCRRRSPAARGGACSTGGRRSPT